MAACVPPRCQSAYSLTLWEGGEVITFVYKSQSRSKIQGRKSLFPTQAAVLRPLGSLLTVPSKDPSLLCFQEHPLQTLAPQSLVTYTKRRQRTTELYNTLWDRKQPRHCFHSLCSLPICWQPHGCRSGRKFASVIPGLKPCGILLLEMEKRTDSMDQSTGQDKVSVLPKGRDLRGYPRVASVLPAGRLPWPSLVLPQLWTSCNLCGSFVVQEHVTLNSQSDSGYKHLPTRKFELVQIE